MKRTKYLAYYILLLIISFPEAGDYENPFMKDLKVLLFDTTFYETTITGIIEKCAPYVNLDTMRKSQAEILFGKVDSSKQMASFYVGYSKNYSQIDTGWVMFVVKFEFLDPIRSLDDYYKELKRAFGVEVETNTYFDDGRLDLVYKDFRGGIVLMDKETGAYQFRMQISEPSDDEPF